jgi:glycosyltransferase involved in cell wall biosynthesis
MIGTDPATRGGISAAIAAWAGAGLFDRWPVTYIATHRDGTRLEKALRAFDAFATFLLLALRTRRGLLHVHGASRASFWRKAPFMAVALLLRWPVIFHLHGGRFADFYERECGPIRQALVRFLLARAACLVGVSPRWEDWLRTTFGNPRVECVPNAVPLPAVVSPRSPTRIAFVGRLTPEKGAWDLLEAIALLRSWHPPVRLELAGDGDADALAQHAHALGIGDRILIRGWCPAIERERLLERSGLFVLPSHAEGLPMSLLEAMGAGCTVVATSVGGIPDLVHDGVNGMLVPPRDPVALAAAITRALSRPAHAGRLAHAARATVARAHSPALAVQRLGRLYSSLGVEPAAAQPQGIPA